MAPNKLYVQANVGVLGLAPGQAAAFDHDHPLYDEAKALADDGTKVEHITKSKAEALGLTDVDEAHAPAPGDTAATGGQA